MKKGEGRKIRHKHLSRAPEGEWNEGKSCLNHLAASSLVTGTMGEAALLCVDGKKIKEMSFKVVFVA